MTINGNKKGKAGELECSKKLTELFGVPCRRSQQYNGLGKGDVVGLDGFHIEVKRTETLSLYKAMEQAQEDKEPDEIPIVIHRKNGKEWLAVIPLGDLPEAVKDLSWIMNPGE